jgi:hypothetical protein
VTPINPANLLFRCFAAGNFSAARLLGSSPRRFAECRHDPRLLVCNPDPGTRLRTAALTCVRPLKAGAACKFGLEGIVSKRRDRPYRAGRSPDWIKVKNRSHPAIESKEAFS